MKITKSLLLVVDVQIGFVVNDATKKLLPKINNLITVWNKQRWPIIFSKFINNPASPWVRYMDYTELMEEPDTQLHPNLSIKSGAVYEKTKLSAWSDEIMETCAAQNINTVVLCGIDTDECVLATAIDIFDAGLRPVLLADCCATSADKQYHDAALLILERMIGEKQILASDKFL